MDNQNKSNSVSPKENLLELNLFETKSLERSFEHCHADLLITRRRLDSANALLDSISEETGKLLNLNNLVEGANVIFKKMRPGIVISIKEPLLGENNNVVRISASIIHDCGTSTLHTYRFDGVSHFSPCMDIIKII